MFVEYGRGECVNLGGETEDVGGRLVGGEGEGEDGEEKFEREVEE